MATFRVKKPACRLAHTRHTTLSRAHSINELWSNHPRWKRKSRTSQTNRASFQCFHVVRQDEQNRFNRSGRQQRGNMAIFDVFCLR